MAVYREGYQIVEEIKSGSKRIFTDAADFGMPCRKGDRVWNMLGQLVDSYGIEGTRVQWDGGVVQRVKLVDEWAVCDERKTLAQATDIFTVSFCKTGKGKCVGYDGYVSVEHFN